APSLIVVPAFAGTTKIILAARCARSFERKPCSSENQRAQGRPGARRTRGPAGNVQKQIRLRAYRFGGITPAFPAQWLYGLYDFVLVTGFLATIIHSRPEPLANLTPAPGRRTQTTSPYASAAFVFAAPASIASPP